MAIFLRSAILKLAAALAGYWVAADLLTIQIPVSRFFPQAQIGSSMAPRLFTVLLSHYVFLKALTD